MIGVCRRDGSCSEAELVERNSGIDLSVELVKRPRHSLFFLSLVSTKILSN